VHKPKVLYLFGCAFNLDVDHSLEVRRLDVSCGGPCITGAQLHKRYAQEI